MTQVDYGEKECIPKKAECREVRPIVSNTCIDKGKVNHCGDGFKRKFKQLWDRAFSSLTSVNGKTQEGGTGNVTLTADDIPDAQHQLTAGDNITITGNVISASGGSEATWGNIIGTLTDQTDLKNALNAKADASSVYDKTHIDSELSYLDNFINSVSAGVTYLDNNTYKKTYIDTQLAGKQGTLTAGAGIAITNNVISCTAGLSIQIVSVLPATGVSGVIYLVPLLGPSTQNIYNEFLWIEGQWEQIGTTQIDLSQYKIWTETQAYIDAKIPTIEVL